jgi:cytochrome c oxidase cbb3-type subunit III
MRTKSILALIAATIVAAQGCKPEGSAKAQATGPGAKAEDRVAAGGAVPAANALSTPRPAKLNPDAGANLFGAMNCDGCHGGGAVGWVGPSLVDGRWRYGGADGAVFHSIFYGRPRGMPAYGGVLSPGAIWKVVTYLQAQPVPKDVPTERWK